MNGLPEVRFPGNQVPSSDFAAVYDGRRARARYIDVDMSVAHSVALGNAIIINEVGNSFYQDQNPMDGIAAVHFQDTNLDATAVPFYVSPGFTARIPFTKILIENKAQAGKRARFVFGVDIDFLPSTSSQLTILGSVTVNELITANTFKRAASGSAGFVTALITAAENTNGCFIHSAFLTTSAAATDSTQASIFASPTSAGYGVTSSRPLTLDLEQCNALSATVNTSNTPNFNRVIPAGWGVFVYQNAGLAGSSASGIVCAELL